MKVNACHLVHSIGGKLVIHIFVCDSCNWILYSIYSVYVYIFQDQESVLIHFKSFTYSKIVNSPN